LALRSFAQVAARHADATLTVVGTGPLAGKLQQLAKKLCVEGRVKFVGKLEKEKVLDLLAEHTALLFTSVRDTSGNVVLEAMSEGVPVIAFRHQGVKEIMDSRSGIFVEPHGGQIDEQGFTEAMDRLISNPEETRAMGVHAMGEAQGRLSWGKKWSAVTPIYSNLMAARLSK
jgi:glycosyltransferase involved in cell wall biosynthesis